MSHMLPRWARILQLLHKIELKSKEVKFHSVNVHIHKFFHIVSGFFTLRRSTTAVLKTYASTKHEMNNLILSLCVCVCV